MPQKPEDRNYGVEYERDQKKRKKYRATLRKQRRKRGLVDSSGRAKKSGAKDKHGRSTTHMGHVGFASKGSKKVRPTSAKKNLRKQPKRK